MIDPLAIADGRGLVIRIGGNALLPRGDVNVDEEVMKCLAALTFAMANADREVVIVIGGVGGQFFIEWARRAGCSDAVLNQIGCELIDLAALIVTDILRRACEDLDYSCWSIPAGSIGEITQAVRQSRIVVAGSGVQGAISSDSLALLIGGHLRMPILSIKRTLPFQDLTKNMMRSLSHTHEINIESMRDRERAGAAAPRPGWHGSIDTWALELLRDPVHRLYITTVSALKAYPRKARLETVVRIAND